MKPMIGSECMCYENVVLTKFSAFSRKVRNLFSCFKNFSHVALFIREGSSQLGKPLLLAIVFLAGMTPAKNVTHMHTHDTS